MQHLDALKCRVVRIPQRGKDLNRHESTTNVELSGLCVGWTRARGGNGLDLQERHATSVEPRLCVSEQTRTQTLAPPLRLDSNTVNFPCMREVLL